MKLLDLFYYLSYKVYVRGNKDTFGAFFMSSLWISALQFFWIMILMISLELFFNMQYISYDDYLAPLMIVIFSILMIINNIYISRRKKILLERFSMSKKNEMLNFLILAGFFMLSFIILGYMFSLRKEMFGY
ncbi:MAG: hypothetical protein U5L09_19280 [Bacteroidales bacterium]|nr:hypothetical protein [Bacteroidales bacterium]